MIERLQKNNLGIAILVFLLALAVRLFAVFFMYPSPYIGGNTIITGVVNYLNGFVWLSFVISFGLVVLQALIISETCVHTGLIQGGGYMGAYFFLLINSLFMGNFLLSEFQIGNLFAFAGLRLMIRLREGYNTKVLFYAGLFFGLSLLIVPDHLWIIVFLVIAVLVYKTIVVKDVLAIVFGLGLPYYFVSSINYIFRLNNEPVETVSNMNDSLKNIVKIGLLPNYSYVIFGVFLIVAVMGLLRQLGGYYKNNTDVRRSITLMALFFVYSLFMLLLHWKEMESFYLLMGFPLTVFLASFFNDERVSWWKDMVNVLLMALVVFSIFGDMLLKNFI